MLMMYSHEEYYNTKVGIAKSLIGKKVIRMRLSDIGGDLASYAKRNGIVGGLRF